MQIIQNLVSSSKYNIKCPYEMKPEYITFHNTSNNASAKNEIAYMIRNDNQVSFHVAVDDVEAIQGIPFNRNAWHCGDGNGSGNRKSIGIEICYSTLGSNDPKFKKAENNAVEVCAQLLNQFGLGIDRLKPHKYWSGKNCPHATNHQEFINKVNAKLNEKQEVIYKIVTGGFGNKEIAQSKLDFLQGLTGWYLTLEEFQPNDFRIKTGGIVGKENVESKVKSLTDLTGWWCTYIIQ